MKKIAYNHRYDIDKWLKENQGKYYCQCGCGEKIILNRRKHYWCGIPKYKQGHNPAKHLKDKSKKFLKAISKTWYKKGQISHMKNKHHSDEAKRKLSLSHGGTGTPYEGTEYGAEFDNTLKAQVRFRDKYKCQLCGCSQLENGKQLDCHHIDYDKKNNILINLIALCMRCHRKTNTSRSYWIKLLTKKEEGQWKAH